MHSNVFIFMNWVRHGTSAKFEKKKPAYIILLCTTAKLAVLHDGSTTWFQTSRYCRAKVEFNSINLVRHGSSTTFETGLNYFVLEGFNILFDNDRVWQLKVFRYSLSETIPVFSNLLKSDFFLLRSLQNFHQWLIWIERFVKMQLLVKSISLWQQ